MPAVQIADSRQLQQVDQAFSKQAPGYDAYEEGHAILRWMRERVRAHTARYLRQGQRILELNAGTGLDAVHFARLGHEVTATDVAEGMLGQLRAKVEREGLEDRVQVQRCSYTALGEIDGDASYDYVFSNFGGLNCIPDLRVVTAALPRLLAPGGYATLVIMPSICPWELALLLRGRPKIATRRLRGRVTARVEGVPFTTYYFSPREVIRAFGERFEVMRLEGLASLSPPPYFERFPEKRPRLYRLLTWLDERVAHLPPFNSFADHFVLTVRLRS